MKKTKLALAIAGGVLSLGGVSVASATSTTMYNLSTASGTDNSTNTTDWTTTIAGGTDGWANGATIGGAGVVGKVANQKWAGTGGDTVTPFGYAGAHLNWALEFSGHTGGSAEISTFDSFNRYGIYADIDTAQGAWNDLNTVNSPAGWLHDTDTGLFKSDVSGTVTLNIQGVLNSGTNFGFTVFKGMDAVTLYAHHNAWNAYANQSGLSAASSPYQKTGGLMPGANLTVADIVAYSVGGANTSNLNTISFDAEAGQVYTIFLGGYRNGGWDATDDGYRLTVSQVPVPAAFWPFGSGLVGLLGASWRRRALLA